jgi:acyl-[acyl-carrier-protein]-phospholipid O-acyltransferase / long-chain-fatty-acid--[acyl-carrier-protein] ligase
VQLGSASAQVPEFDVAPTRTTLFGALLDARDRYGRDQKALEDPERSPLTYARLVLGALILGRKLAAITAPGETVGVLLPNMQVVAVVLFALNAHGRVPAMLNFTGGVKNLRAACELASIRTLLTSRRFIELAKLDDVINVLSVGRRILFIEDARAGITSVDKARGVAASLMPRRAVARAGVQPDHPGVILFTSGSEGLPKGVVLSNANLVANAAQVAAHAGSALTTADTLFIPLPVFHVFGLTGLLLGLLHGVKVVLYPTPLHYREVPRLIRATGATILLATDFFLQGYARAAEEGDLRSIRYVIAGGERVKDETRRLWARTGITILEGYGATECMISCNLPDRNRPGTVGPFLPGIAWKLEPVEGIHEGARLCVSGPNMMLGYIAGDGSFEAPAGGFHDTGDIVSVQDGFVIIRGRAKRFAKIGGEMVSLAAVESLAQGLWPESIHAAVALPDRRKGEQVVLVTEKDAADREALVARGRAQGLPELWLPRTVLVTRLPVMASGKIDYTATAEMVRKLRPNL